MADRSLFVDFMYAVTVGAALPRLDEKSLHPDSPLLWGLIFLIAVFLEDFYLYHLKVVPNLKDLPTWRGFILAMLIIGTWYISQAAYPSNQRLFALAFSSFFLLKLLGGVFMKPTQYPTAQDTIFLLPVIAGMILAILSKHVFFASHPGHFLWVLVPVWLVTVIVWWSMDGASVLAHSTK